MRTVRHIHAGRRDPARRGTKGEGALPAPPGDVARRSLPGLVHVGGSEPRYSVAPCRELPRRSTQIGGAMEMSHGTESAMAISGHSGLGVRVAVKHGAYGVKPEPTLNGALTATSSTPTSGGEGAR